ncbi:MAG: exodeoxyribonuclease VII large subunit [Lentisphaerae bacterium]|nr:exodeoxyribonuclease VII large subunit [Lentisphaerota bacterium]
MRDEAVNRRTGGIEPRVYPVSEVTRLIRSVLEDEVGEVWVEGELSNLRRPSSGHWYFTLKDEQAQLSAVMFRGHQRGVRFEPRDGLKVRAFGQISVYEKSGQVQLVVRLLEESGIGALQAAFEKLKLKLQGEGLFDPARKRPIPAFPQHIGIVTSPTGAALRDILNILFRRYPNLHVVLVPVRVQGDGAAGEIAEAIERLNRHGGVDVMIVGRGGGSLEDLWCFNEEIVARAIVRSGIPVISAVGHEIDFTIVDFVADLRAPTPSAAAELVIRPKAEFERSLREQARRLERSLRQNWLGMKNRFLAVAGSYVFREPAHVVRRYRDGLQQRGLRMRHRVESRLREVQQAVDEGAFRMTRQIRESRQLCVLKVGRLEAQLRVMNPLAVLRRGYSITSHPDGRVVKSVRDVQPGRLIRSRVADGILESEVRRQCDDETGGKNGEL